MTIPIINQRMVPACHVGTSIDRYHGGVICSEPCKVQLCAFKSPHIIEISESTHFQHVTASPQKRGPSTERFQYI